MENKNDENRTVTLNDEALEQISGGTKVQSEDPELGGLSKPCPNDSKNSSITDAN